MCLLFHQVPLLGLLCEPALKKQSIFLLEFFLKGFLIHGTVKTRKLHVHGEILTSALPRKGLYLLVPEYLLIPESVFRDTPGWIQRTIWDAVIG